MQDAEFGCRINARRTNMGILSSPESSSKLTQFLKKLYGRSRLVLSLCYICGCAWMIGSFWPAFSRVTYFSENALLPGLVDEQFNEVRKVQDHLRGLQQSEIPLDYVAKAMADARMEVFEQNFTFVNPLQPNDSRSHRNLYGIVRAPRANGIESLVVVSPIDRQFLPGVAMLLTLADFCRNQVYWAKDLIFVFTEAKEVGMQAWLSAYHDSPIEHLRVDSLQGHSGAIQAAIVFQSELMDVTHVDIKYQMVNGQLPNLDLFNLVSRMTEKYGIEATIHRKRNPGNAFSERGYKRFLTTAATGLLIQATGRPTGLHSVFGQYGIEAVSMVPYKLGKNSKTLGALSQVRVLEGILRSLNNLLERFHQSFFFYILASTERFVSIGNYMPGVGILLLMPLLKAVWIWIEMQDWSAWGTKDDKDTAAASSSSTSGNSCMSLCIPFWLTAHGVGLAFHYLPTLLMSDWLSSDGTDVFDRLFRGSVALMLGVPVIVRFLRRDSWSLLKRDFRILRCISLLELSLVIGAASLLNFALGLTLGLVLLPFYISVNHTDHWFRRRAQLLVLTLINPLVFALIGSVVYLVVSNPEGHSWTWQSASVLFHSAVQLTNSSLATVVSDSFLFRSWLYGFVCHCVIPTWVLFFSLASM